ncbi:proliferating cell nuclear antigen (pcna) [Candidatus Thorarchaeota archaeon]|nr:MAG: proliferating cell nuclear antigen (pcna) [Candidatus Thorarchaeota archaeon]
MFHATLDSTKTWKQIVDALATLLTEVHFVISESGIALRQLDSSKAAMVDLFLPADVSAGIFQEYNCEGEHDICLGVDELNKVTKRMAGDDRLEFNLDTDNRRFEIKMIGQAERQFKLQLLTPPEDRTKKPKLAFNVEAEVFADAFKQAVKDIGVVSSHVKISAKAGSISFSGEGDTGEAEVSLKSEGEDPVVFSLKVKEESNSMYALNYLSEITKAMASDSLSIQFSTDKPIHLEFAIAETGNISFILAPRVERRRLD